MSREKFEQWAFNIMGWPIGRHTNRGHYLYSRTQDAWMGYELAMKSQ